MSRITTIHKSFAFILSVVVLIGAIGVSADFHICQGKVKSFSFFGEAEKCSEMEQGEACSTPESKHTIDREKCCKNQTISETASFQCQVISEPTALGDALILPNSIPHLGIEIAKTQLTQWNYEDPPLIRHSSTFVIAYQSYLI